MLTSPFGNKIDVYMEDHVGVRALQGQGQEIVVKQSAVDFDHNVRADQFIVGTRQP